MSLYLVVRVGGDDGKLVSSFEITHLKQTLAGELKIYGLEIFRAKVIFLKLHADLQLLRHACLTSISAFCSLYSLSLSILGFCLC